MRREFLKAAGALIGAAAISLFGGGRAVAQGPTLTNTQVRFHTNNEDKDHDTHVTVTVRDADGIVAARVSNDFGHFSDNNDNGPFALSVVNASNKGALQRGRITIRIDPNGHDTWRFNFFVVLTLSDGSTLTAGADGLDLSQDRRQQEFGIEGIIRQ